MKLRIFALAVMSAAAFVPAVHGAVRTQGGAQPQTTTPNLFVDIQVTITDTRIAFDRRSAPRASEARFVIRNIGTKSHDFTIGTGKPGTGAQSGFSRILKPNQQKIVLFFLSYRGPFPYRSTTPADSGKPGMKGIFRIL